MPNQRSKKIRQTSITVDEELHAWALEEAKRRGINDFSTFVRVLIAMHKAEVEKQSMNHKNSE